MRRFRSRGTWFPTIGSAGADDIDNVSGKEFSLVLNAGGTTSVIVAPCTYDVPAEGDIVDPDDPGALAGMVGQEYFLRRIVGKIFLENRTALDTTGETTFPGAALVGAGFFVARAASEHAGGGANVPIGAASAIELQENYNPLSEDCIREPWIWRRTWVLTSAVLAAAQKTLKFAGAGVIQSPNWSNLPATNVEYGSVQDGPHIDAKTKRRVKLDERLWFVVACKPLPVGTTVEASGAIRGYLDYRLFADLRKARNRGVF